METNEITPPLGKAWIGCDELQGWLRLVLERDRKLKYIMYKVFYEMPFQAKAKSVSRSMCVCVCVETLLGDSIPQSTKLTYRSFSRSPLLHIIVPIIKSFVPRWVCGMHTRSLINKVFIWYFYQPTVSFVPILLYPLQSELYKSIG